jgi:hypothetical protein
MRLAVVSGRAKIIRDRLAVDVAQASDDSARTRGM